jgi:1-acyl-sn-glycerol-3-phosphate acyltransferase
MAARALRAGALVGIFPESAVSTTTDLLPLKKGAAALATETQVPLVPVLVWGGQQLITKGIPPRWRRAHRAEIHIEFGTPMRPPPESDPEETTARLRAALTDMIAVRLVTAS